MKLLFDENLSHRLVEALDDLYPESAHVRDSGLSSAADAGVWEYAKREGFAIISKDSHLRQRSFLLGAPPKVIWVRCGNCSTDEIESLIRDGREMTAAFEENPSESFLVVSA